MKNIRILIIASLSCAMLFTACRKDQDEIVDTPILQENQVLGTITGQVIDERNEPVENATVFLNNDIQTTDENGFFLFKDKILNSTGTVVKVQSPQHFQVSKIVNPKAATKTIINIKLLDKELVGTISTSTGGTVEIERGGLAGQIDFEENAFVLEGSTEIYAGEVQIYGRVINPANENDLLTIPGDLRGMNSANEMVQLASYSMMGIVLETNDGRKIQLADNKEATISFPIDPSLQENAPANIPLWHYNIETGHWEEEGSAVLINNQYLGKVSHFSFWNCDAPFPIVQISGRVFDENGQPLAGITVGIKIVDSGLVGFGITNTSGEFVGGIPKDEELEITFSKNHSCKNFSISQNLGAFSSDIALGDLDVNLSDLHTISGRLLTCDEKLVEDGLIIMSFDEGNNIGYANENGFFMMPICNSNFNISGFDYTNNLRSEPIDFELVEQEDIDIGDLVLCNTLETYITLEYMNSTIKIEDAISLQDTIFSLSIIAEQTGPDTLGYKVIQLGIELDLNDDITGQHDNINFYYYVYDGTNIGCSAYYAAECNISAEITEADPEDIYIIGTYEGTVKNYEMKDEITPVSGTFKALRTF